MGGFVMNRRRNFIRLAGAALVTPAFGRQARADVWPSHDIHAIIPFSAGSSVDIVGRIVLDPLQRALGQTIIIDNRGGAGGVIGSALVATAPADGYTILVNASAHSAAPAAYPKITYDPVRDFSAVVSFGSIPNVTVVKPNRGFKTLRDLANAAQAGTFTFSSAGIGSATHWAAERFRISAGFKATHVPFRGGPEAIMEVVAGRVDFACMGISSALPLIADGQLIPLAVSTPMRSSALPNVPTTLEAGFPDSDYTFWNGMFVPAKTPRAIIDRLYDETQKVLRLPDVLAKFKPQGIEPMPMTPTEFDALIKKEVAANFALVKAAGLKFD
jgi:tripartite-type tricarboxylate transporter receptor subunit TctC